MITYESTQRGDILEVIVAVEEDEENNVAALKKGALVRVTEAFKDGVKVEDEDGGTHEFYKEDGAAHLEKTEYKDEFPEQKKARLAAEGKAEVAREKKAKKDKEDAEKEAKKAAKK